MCFFNLSSNGFQLYKPFACFQAFKKLQSAGRRADD